MTKHRRPETAFSIVAWAGYAIDLSLGWSRGKNIGRRAAIKELRDRYGYQLEDNGREKRDHNGRRITSSSMYEHIAAVNDLLIYLAKYERLWIDDLKNAVQSHNESAYSQLLEALATKLAQRAAGTGLKEIRYWLKHFEIMPAELPKSEERLVSELVELQEEFPFWKECLTRSDSLSRNQINALIEFFKGELSKRTQTEK